MNYNATLCKEALGKKITGMSCEAYVFCFERWASFLPDGFTVFNKSTFVFNHQAKCLMCVGTKTVTVIFLEPWEGVTIGNLKH